MTKKGELRHKYFGIPLDRGIDNPEEDFATVRGYFTSDQRDEAGDIITRGATERSLGKYRKWGNIRYMHQPRPVGKITRIGQEDGLDWNEVELKVIDPEAVFMVRNGLLAALSVGILISFEDIEFLEDGGWLINDYSLAEISLVDHPANYDAVLTSVKGLVADMARIRGADTTREYLKELEGELDTVENILPESEDAVIIEAQEITDVTLSADVENLEEAENLEETETEIDLEKSPACRQEGESVDDCVSRKIPEIMDENPDMDHDQAVAIAHSICSEKCGDKVEDVLNSDECLEKDVEEDEEQSEPELEEELPAALPQEDVLEEKELPVEPEIVESDPVNLVDTAEIMQAQLERMEEIYKSISNVARDIAMLVCVFAKALAEAPEIEEHVEGEGDPEQLDILSQKVEQLEAENAELVEKVEFLSVPANRKGAILSVDLPEEIVEEEEIDSSEMPLKRGVRNYLKSRTITK